MQNFEILGGLTRSNSRHVSTNPNIESYRQLSTYTNKVYSAWTEVWPDTWPPTASITVPGGRSGHLRSVSRTSRELRAGLATPAKNGTDGASCRFCLASRGHPSSSLLAIMLVLVLLDWLLTVLLLALVKVASRVL